MKLVFLFYPFIYIYIKKIITFKLYFNFFSLTTLENSLIADSSKEKDKIANIKDIEIKELAIKSTFLVIHIYIYNF